MTETNTPTRKGERISTLSKMAEIETPSVGMKVFVEDEAKEYIILSLKNKIIDGVDVPNAQVDKYKALTWEDDFCEFVDDTATAIKNVGTVIKTESERAKNAESKLNTKATARFDGFQKTSVSVNEGESDSPITGVVFYTIENIFIGKTDGGSFYRYWDGESEYMNSATIHRNKLYLYGGEVYIWDGNTLVDVTAGVKELIKAETTRAQTAESVLDAKIEAEKQKVSDLIGEAPETLDSIHEIASWINNDEEASAAMAAQINKNKTAITDETARAKAAEAVLRESTTVRFARVEENEAVIKPEAIDAVAEVVYYRPSNIFVAADSNGNYYDNWEGIGAYMSGGKVRDDKVFLCGGEAYVWNGAVLSLLTDKVETVCNIVDVIALDGANGTGVYKATRKLEHGHTYRIYPSVAEWDTSFMADNPNGATFEIYYKINGSAWIPIKVLSLNGKTSIKEYYEVTIPDYFPVENGLTIYVRAPKGERITFVFEDITTEMKKEEPDMAQYTADGIVGTNIPLTQSLYLDTDNVWKTLIDSCTAIVEVKKGDVFCITGTTDSMSNLFTLLDVDKKIVNNSGRNIAWDRGFYRVYVDGYMLFSCLRDYPHRIVRLDPCYLATLNELDIIDNARFATGYIYWGNGDKSNSTVNHCSGYVPTLGFNRIELSVNVVSSEDISTGIAFYDADRNYISGIPSRYYGGDGEYVKSTKVTDYPIPENAAFFRTTIFSDALDGMVLRLHKTENEIYYPYESLTWKSGYPYYNTGAIGTSSVNKYCEIAVDGREFSVIEAIVAKTALGASPGIVFYDDNDTYIIGHQYPNYGVSDTTSVVITPEVRRYRIPRTTRKIRIACRKVFSNTFYCKLYNEEASNYDSITRLNGVVQERRKNMLVGAPKLYISEKTSDAYLSLNGKKTSELYAEWDKFVELYPDYISRGEDLGEVTKGSATYQLRQYTVGYNRQWLIDHEPAKDEIVTQTATNHWQIKDNARKILIPIGMHGEEKTACWGAMLAIKELLESNEDWALFIKSNFILKIVPTLNPSGFNDCVRVASDGNVMNRETSVETPETLMYYDWVSKNTDAFILMDFHGTQGRYAYLPCWDGSPVFDLVKRATVQLSALLYENYKEFYNSACDGYGTTYAPFLIAKYSKEVSYYSCSYRIWEDYGIPTFALETPANLVVPNSDGSVNENLSGLIGENDLRNCKIAKDLLINSIQIFGCMDSAGDYYVR